MKRLVIKLVFEYCDYSTMISLCMLSKKYLRVLNNDYYWTNYLFNNYKVNYSNAKLLLRVLFELDDCEIKDHLMLANNENCDKITHIIEDKFELIEYINPRENINAFSLCYSKRINDVFFVYYKNSMNDWSYTIKSTQITFIDCNKDDILNTIRGYLELDDEDELIDNDIKISKNSIINPINLLVKIKDDYYFYIYSIDYTINNPDDTSFSVGYYYSLNEIFNFGNIVELFDYEYYYALSKLYEELS
jgi:hypothetical protein